MRKITKAEWDKIWNNFCDSIKKNWNSRDITVPLAVGGIALTGHVVMAASWIGFPVICSIALGVLLTSDLMYNIITYSEDSKNKKWNIALDILYLCAVTSALLGIIALTIGGPVAAIIGVVFLGVAVVLGAGTLAVEIYRGSSRLSNMYDHFMKMMGFDVGVKNANESGNWWKRHLVNLKERFSSFFQNPIRGLWAALCNYSPVIASACFATAALFPVTCPVTLPLGIASFAPKFITEFVHAVKSIRSKINSEYVSFAELPENQTQPAAEAATAESVPLLITPQQGNGKWPQKNDWQIMGEKMTSTYAWLHNKFPRPRPSTIMMHHSQSRTLHSHGGNRGQLFQNIRNVFNRILHLPANRQGRLPS